MGEVSFELKLPEWVDAFTEKAPAFFPSREERMGFVISLAAENVRRSTGGPFGAAIFDQSGKLISPGINVVTSAKCSIFHAEMVAIILAQKKLGRYDMGESGKYYYELVTSTEPCAMCLGAIPWAGIGGIVCGARDEDAREIGFEEGAKPPFWKKSLEERGISVTLDILREKAASVLKDYVDTGGIVYNSGKDD